MCPSFPPCQSRVVFLTQKIDQLNCEIQEIQNSRQDPEYFTSFDVSESNYHEDIPSTLQHENDAFNSNPQSRSRSQQTPPKAQKRRRMVTPSRDSFPIPPTFASSTRRLNHSLPHISLSHKIPELVAQIQRVVIDLQDMSFDSGFEVDPLKSQSNAAIQLMDGDHKGYNAIIEQIISFKLFQTDLKEKIKAFVTRFSCHFRATQQVILKVSR